MFHDLVLAFLVQWKRSYGYLTWIWRLCINPGSRRQLLLRIPHRKKIWDPLSLSPSQNLWAKSSWEVLPNPNVEIYCPFHFQMQGECFLLTYSSNPLMLCFLQLSRYRLFHGIAAKMRRLLYCFPQYREYYHLPFYY